MITTRDFKKIVLYFTFPALIYVLQIFLLFFEVYDYYPWLDIPIHFIGGFAIAFTFFFIFKYLQEKSLLILPKVARIMFVVSLVTFTAVLFEFFEFILEHLTGYGFQGTIEDTMLDLFLGILGGFFGAFILEMIYSKMYFKHK